MYKKYLLKCDIENLYTEGWDHREFYFDTIDEMKHFVKYGNKNIRPQHIRVESSFELNKIDLDII